MLGLIVMGVIIAALVVTMGALQAARKEANYQESLVDSFEKLANSHWKSGEQEHRRAEALEESLRRASADRKDAETSVHLLTGTVAELVDEVGGLEEDLEEAEELVDDMEESANEALAGWAQADALTETTLAWGTRVVDLMERFERRQW